MALSLCGRSTANTGEIACDKSRGVLKKIFIFNGEIDSADYETEDELFNKLVEYSKLSKSATNKVFPINEAQEITDNSEQNVTGTLGLGFTTVLREGKPAYQIKLFAGSDLLKRLRTFNNQTVRILEWDANSTLWGTKSGSKYKGFQAKLFFSGNKLATGQNVEEGVVTVTISILSTSEYFDNAYWASLTGNIEDIKPLIDVNMVKVSNASNVHQISFIAPGSNIIGGYNIYSDYGTELAALAANFTAFSGAGSNPTTPLTITSVTANSTLGTLAFTFDNTEYGTATGNIRIVGPTPVQLDAGDVSNVELLPLLYAKP